MLMTFEMCITPNIARNFLLQTSLIYAQNTSRSEQVHKLIHQSKQLLVANNTLNLLAVHVCVAILINTSISVCLLQVEFHKS